MAPRRKKGGNHAKEMERFRVGDLVLAKVKGFAAWPAKISRPEDWKRLPDPKKCFVRFFGTSEIGFVPPSNIKIFTIELKSELTGRPRIRQSKDFACAVDEICQAFEELQAQKEELELQQNGIEEALESSTEMKLKKERISFEDPGTVRERKSQMQPSLSAVSPVNNEKRDKLPEEETVQIEEKKSFSEGTFENLNTSLEAVRDRKSQTPSDEKRENLHKEEIVQIERKKSFSEGTVENPNTSHEAVRERKSQTPSSPSTVSPVRIEKRENLREEEIDQIEMKKSFSKEGTIDGPTACPKAVRERKSPSPSPSKVSPINNGKRVTLREEKIVGIQGKESFSKDRTIEGPNTSTEGSKGTENPTPSSPSTVCPTSDEKREKLFEEEIVGTQRNDSLSEGTIKDWNTSLESSRERKSPTLQPSPVSPVDKVKRESPLEEETVQHQKKTPNVSLETVRERKSQDPHFSSVSSVSNDKKESLLDEETIRNQSKVRFVMEETLEDTDTSEEAVRERKSSSPPSLSVPPINNEKRECLLEEETVQFQRKKRFSKEVAIEDHSTSPQAVRERKTQTPAAPSTVSPVDNKKRENPVEEEIVQIRRKKRTSKGFVASPGTVRERKSPAPPSPPIVKEAIARTRRKKRFSSEETGKDPTTSPGTVRERKSPTPPTPSMALPIDNMKRENPSKEEITRIQRKKRIPTCETKTQASKRQRQENTAEQKADPSVIKVLENQKADPSVSLSRKSHPHTRRRLRQIDDEEDEVKEGAGLEDNFNIKDHHSPIESPVNSEKTPEKYDRQRSSSSLDGQKSDRNTSNKEKAMVKGSIHSIAAVRQMPKPSFSENEKIGEKFQTEDSSKGFDLLQESADTSVSYKSKFVDSSTSMKDLIAVAQAKRKETHSLGTLPLVFPLGRERSRSPVTIGPRLSPDNDGPVISLLNSVVSEKDERIALSGNDAAIAREAFEVMVEMLSRTKESIGRATHQAIECAKFNMAGEIVDLLIRKLETEISFRRRIDLFFLVDSITQCSHSRKGIAGASYVSSVQASLTRLLNAAAPPGAAACENRHQCLKVLRLWLERKVLPESVLRPIIEDIEVPGVDQNSGLYLRRQFRSERSIDDPIREMDGMLVDEYGSNVAFQISGLLSLHGSDDEEEEEEDDLPRGSCEDVSADVDNALEEQREVLKTPVKYQQCYVEVEKESEVEDSEERENSTVDDSPPLPANLPPSPPPLPSSPPPPPPPPPLQLLSSDPAPTPTPTPVMYTAAQYMAYPPMHQNHFMPTNGQNPFVMPGVNAGHQEVHLPPQAYHPMQFPFPQLPPQHPNLTQLPAQHLNLAQPPAQHPNLAQPPNQHVNLAQPPAQLPNVAQPPAQQPNLTQLPAQQPNLAQPPPQQPNLTQPPAQQHNLAQPPLQPINFQYPIQNPYFFPTANMTLQQMGEVQWASYSGWIPFSGVPLANDGRFNSNLVAPVGSVQVPPTQGGPQIFPLNSWRPS